MEMSFLRDISMCSKGAIGFRSTAYLALFFLKTRRAISKVN